jgi:Recombinase
VLDPETVPSGLQIVALVVDEEEGERRGLSDALRRIAAGDADTLYVSRLGTAAGSLVELIRLLDWLQAADVGLDTGDRAGRHSVALLREIEGWERDPARRPRGRPGLTAGSPELARRIELMRERGLSLQAIAAALNAEGIATPRGGAQWRPSSVQSALGYRRPRPPAPGAPPPPRAGKRPGHAPARRRRPPPT